MFRLRIKALASLFLLLFFFSQNLYAQDSKSAVYKGELVFNFNVDTAFVQFGIVNPSIKKIASGDTLIVSNGFYHLFLSFPTSEDLYVTRNVLKDSTYTINHNFDLSRNTIDFGSPNASLKYLIGGNKIILTDEDTKIFIDDNFKSMEYYAFFSQNSKQQLRFENAEFSAKERIFDQNTNQKIQIQRFYFYPDKNRFPLYAVLPGMTHLKEKNYSRLALMLSGLAVSTGYFVKYQKEYSSMLPEYNVIRDLYLQETDETRALDFAQEMNDHRKKFESVNTKRNLALYGIIGFVTIDIINKVKLYRKLEARNNKKIDFFIEPKLEKYLSMGATINF